MALRSFIFSWWLTASVGVLCAQPANDACNNAFFITDAIDWCSAGTAFTTEEATHDVPAPGSCLNGGGADVWFAFTPVATDITITIIGNGSNSLLLPEIALFEGPCGQLLEKGCRPAPPFGRVNELTTSGLRLGITHYILVRGGMDNEGVFQLCIRNFNAPVEPTSDCPQAAILCNKEPFVVQQVLGAGNDPSEANDAPCLAGIGNNVETFSTWFVWTADSSGLLTFILTPLNPPDDIDFVLYEMPNGPGDCSGKIPLRCMASSCDGPTGLRMGSTDLSEPPNCLPSTQDNFLAPVSMEAGKTYGLMVNNFSATGSGVGVEFGGPGTFDGPEGRIATVPAAVCEGQPLTFYDATSYPNGTIVEWEWDFGPGASPAKAYTAGPHDVTYEYPGNRLALLRMKTDRGCIVSVVHEVEAMCCDGRFEVQAAIEATACPGRATGAIQLDVDNPYGGYSFTWANGREGAMIDSLPAGSYPVTIRDSLGCDTTLSFTVDGAIPFEVDTIARRPTCDGGSDGALILEVSGGTPPYLFSWQGAPFSPENELQNISAGNYEVAIRDAQGCESILTLALQELELQLEPTVSAITPPTCTGASDGAIRVTIANGRPPYQYDFNDGNGFGGNSQLSGLSAGAYQVEAVDANNCRGNFSFLLVDPPPLTFEIEAVPPSCFGLADGSLAALPAGGTGSYSYLWSNAATARVIDGLMAGAYQLSLTDDRGCTIESGYTLEEPLALVLNLASSQDAICHGDSTGALAAIITEGGIPPYRYRLGGGPFQDAPAFAGLPAGAYVLSAEDANGCVTTLPATVAQPPPLIVTAAEVPEVSLGETVRLQATAIPPGLSFLWSPADSLSCADCPTPSLLPLETATFIVEVEDEKGCTASDTVQVRVSEERPLYIPSAFSPNADGRNDAFTGYGGPGVQYIREMKVFNRWGALVFSAENLSPNLPVTGWDGNINNQPAPSGVYTYIIEAVFIDGQTRRYSGSVSLLR